MPGLVVEFHWRGLTETVLFCLFQLLDSQDRVSHRVAISVYMYVCPFPVIFILRPLFWGFPDWMRGSSPYSVPDCPRMEPLKQVEFRVGCMDSLWFLFRIIPAYRLKNLEVFRIGPTFLFCFWTQCYYSPKLIVNVYRRQDFFTPLILWGWFLNNFCHLISPKVRTDV